MFGEIDTILQYLVAVVVGFMAAKIVEPELDIMGEGHGMHLNPDGTA
jgi:hypothetical protein